MKSPITKVVSAVIVFCTSLTASASSTLLIPDSAPIALIACFLALSASGIAVWLKWKKENHTDIRNAIKRSLKHNSVQWRDWAHETKRTGEIESAIYGVESYFLTEGKHKIAELLTTNETNTSKFATALLEHAATMHPGAFREFDRTGKEDQTTTLARKLLLTITETTHLELQKQQQTNTAWIIPAPRLLQTRVNLF